MPIKISKPENLNKLQEKAYKVLSETRHSKQAIAEVSGVSETLFWRWAKGLHTPSEANLQAVIDAIAVLDKTTKPRWRWRDNVHKLQEYKSLGLTHAEIAKIFGKTKFAVDLASSKYLRAP